MKKILVGIVLIASFVLLTACEKKKVPQKISNTTSANEFHIWTVGQKDFLDTVAREFLSKSGYPSVQPKVTEFDSEREMQQFLVEKMAEDLSPDVVLTNADWIFTNRKKLMALKGDPKFTPEAFDAAFVKAATEPLLSEGALLGIPLSVETLATIYNREILIDSLENRNVPGKTWEEIRLDAQKLTQTNNSFSRLEQSGIALGDLKSVKYGIDVLKNMLVQNGLKFFTEDQKRANFSRQIVVDEDGANKSLITKVIHFFASFSNPQYKQFSWSPLLVKDKKHKDLMTFVQGKTAVVFAYPSDIVLLEDLVAQTAGSISFKDVSTALFPQASLQNKELLARVKALAVPKSARNPLVSWEFLKYMSKKEIHEKLFEVTHIPSARLDLIAEHGKTPLYDVFVRQAKFARTFVFPKPIPENVFDDDLIKIFDTVKFGNDRLTKNIRRYETTLNKVLEDYWKKDEMINKLRPAVVKPKEE